MVIFFYVYWIFDNFDCDLSYFYRGKGKIICEGGCFKKNFWILLFMLELKFSLFQNYFKLINFLPDILFYKFPFSIEHRKICRVD
jgi:hypothetical protein